MAKKCEHGLYFKDCKFCSIYENTQGLIDKSMLLDINTNTKAREFIDMIAKSIGTYDAELVCRHIAHMPDVKWDDLLATIAVNRTRDLNVGKFTIPKYNDLERLALTDFIWTNNTCGLHNSYWSRMWWMSKGGKLIKTFPPNSMLEEFERGKRRAKT